MTETCGMCNPSGAPPCGKPAAHRVIAMCVHEHDLSDCYLCDDCVWLAELGGHTCARCERSARPHQCPVTVRLEPIGVPA